MLHRQHDDLAPAIDALRTAFRLAPADARIAHSLARAHLEAGLPSANLFEAARRLAPNDGDVLLGLAAARLAEGQADRAVEELDRMLLAHPGWLPGHDALSRLRWQTGDRAGFTASYGRALAAHPADKALWRGLLVLLTQGDLYREALEVIKQGRRSCGPDLLFDANEAVCRSELGEIDVADRLFEQLAAVDEATLRVRHVRHLIRTGRASEAAALAEPMTETKTAHFFWPYLSVAWRLTSDPRWSWLEGNERFVGVYDLTDSLPSLKELAASLRRLHVARYQPLEQSVRGGTQTDGSLFSRTEPEIRQLRRAIAAAVDRHAEQLPHLDGGHPLWAPRRGPVRFAGSWSVRLTTAGYHANHIHPAGWFSSALYVALPSPEERGPGQAGWLSLGQPQAELGIDLPPTQLVEPKPGRLVLFPSTMWHGTLPIVGGERLTVAFDVARPR